VLVCAVAASGLAKAAHDKNEALNEDNQVAENTANLLKEELYFYF
jgi:hypothetical protein